MNETHRLACRECDRTKSFTTLRRAHNSDWSQIVVYGFLVELGVREHRALCPTHSGVDETEMTDNSTTSTDSDDEESTQQERIKRHRHRLQG